MKMAELPKDKSFGMLGFFYAGKTSAVNECLREASMRSMVHKLGRMNSVKVADYSQREINFPSKQNKEVKIAIGNFRSNWHSNGFEKEKTMISRRKFIKISAMAGAGVMLPIRWIGRGKAFAFSQSPLNIRKFFVPLPGLGASGLPALTPTTKFDPQTGLLTDYYSIQMGQFTQKLHPDLPGPTTLWGYSDAVNPVQRYLGGVIVAQEGRPVRLKVKNNLPNKHPLPVDTTIMGSEPGQQVNRAAVHLHGGLTPWTSDGVPFSWFTPAGGPVGETFLNGVGPGTAEYYYPNQQSSRLVWYHDHAMGITRLNAYAGLASAYIIRDELETNLIKSRIIPSNEIPLIIQDKTFCQLWSRPIIP
jgi:spore coat protein A